MNYRHAFHAGNFADVVKHAVLARILTHLSAKPTPFRVIDTHAGAGIYDLARAPSERTGEWRGGVGRLDEAPLPEEAEALLAPWRQAIAGLRAERGATFYPGSPEIARRMARAGDRVIAVESEERVFALLRQALGRDARAKAVRLDGWTALGAYVPPKERRGLVLIDPPYENPEEFEVVAGHLATAWRKWPTGVYAIWYPIVDRALVERFVARVAADIAAPMLRAEVTAHGGGEGRGLGGCGLIVVHPPWKLEAELAVLLPALAKQLAAGAGGGWRLERVGEGNDDAAPAYAVPDRAGQTGTRR